MPTQLSTVFISSTALDLGPYRDRLAEVARRLNLHDIAMEHFGARDEKPLAECLELVRDSDYFVGIYAHRYGFVPEAETKSITELEYDAASEAGLQRLIFLVDPSVPWLPAMIDGGSAAVRLQSFKERLGKQHICELFTSPDDLAAKAATALSLAVKKSQLVDVARDAGATSSESARAHGELLTGEDWARLRDAEKARSRRIYLAHDVYPSSRPGQVADILVYLAGGRRARWDEVASAEFYLGEKWGDRVFRVEKQGDGPLGIWLSAYGPPLCVCRVTFTDGEQVVLSRFLNIGVLDATAGGEIGTPSPVAEP